MAFTLLLASESVAALRKDEGVICIALACNFTCRESEGAICKSTTCIFTCRLERESKLDLSMLCLLMSKGKGFTHVKKARGAMHSPLRKEAALIALRI